jgi:hypothetical protein
VNEESIKILVEEYRTWSDGELIRAYQENDQDQYGEVAFEAMRRIATKRNLTLPSQQEYIPSPKEKKSWLKENIDGTFMGLLAAGLVFVGYKSGCRDYFLGGDKTYQYTEENLKKEMEIFSEKMLPIKIDKYTTCTKAWAGPGLQKTYLYEIDPAAGLFIDAINSLPILVPGLLPSGTGATTPAEFLENMRAQIIAGMKEGMSEKEKKAAGLHFAESLKQGVTYRYVYKFSNKDISDVIDGREIGEVIILPNDVLSDAGESGDDEGSISDNPDRIKIYPGGEAAWAEMLDLFKSPF